MKVDYIRRGGDLAVLEPEIAMVAQVQSRDSFVISRKHSRNHEADFIPCCLNSSAFYVEELLHLGAHKGGNCLNLMQGRTKPQFIYSKETCAWAAISSSGCFMSETTILEKGHGSVRLAGAVIRSSIGKFESTFRRNRQRRELALINCAIKFFEAGDQIVYLGSGNGGKATRR